MPIGLIHPNVSPWLIDHMKVVIEQMEDNLYHAYDESGAIVEGDFKSYDEAETHMTQNGYTVVESFNV